MFEACPSSRMVDLREKDTQEDTPAGKVRSQLRQWPVQLHLVSPLAPYFQGADVLLSADCVAYALGNFHNDYLKASPLLSHARSSIPTRRSIMRRSRA